MMSVRLKLTITPLPWLFELVSIYIKLSPIGDKNVAPERLVREFVLNYWKKFCIFLLLFLSFQKVF